MNKHNRRCPLIFHWRLRLSSPVQFQKIWIWIWFDLVGRPSRINRLGTYNVLHALLLQPSWDHDDGIGSFLVFINHSLIPQRRRRQLSVVNAFSGKHCGRVDLSWARLGFVILGCDPFEFQQQLHKVSSFSHWKNVVCVVVLELTQWIKDYDAKCLFLLAIRNIFFELL